MEITPQILDDIAKLAKLTIQQQQKEKLRADITDILELVARMNAIDTSKVEPMHNSLQKPSPLRIDQPEECSSLTPLLIKNAPAHYENYLLVPKVLE